MDNLLSDVMTDTEFSIVYNMLSLGIASMLFTSIFLWVARDRVLPKYRLAVMVSATVTSIAAYHYFRMFDSFHAAYGGMHEGDVPGIVQAFAHYNVGYRYVDWFLTVPLLLVELVAVLGLAREKQSSLLKRLVPAAALMIILGYPGDLKLNLFGIDAHTSSGAGIWGALSTIPFLYILYVLWVELSKSLSGQSDKVRRLFSGLRLLLIATWGVYPITYILAMGHEYPSASDVVAREVGYTIADILAKCLFGLIIFTIARIKSSEDDKNFAAQEGH
ncbi:MAG: xanthorhodopsin [Micrococcales bacterium]|nr:xanthorhodopsin [Micrococcales bacterium]NBR55139.1 xanthorhodopsin [Micrococcales bacterium]NBR62130.1 xanthorhodopsin [Actinomycetota bacterium]NBY43326.1 xanthorhodopsin [Micrococcales bacterium]NDE89141.1 xanthorhodopsin [Micrococcales bacterium]